MHKENFTAILPVTCNANCGFCLEKEMKYKASKEQWLMSLQHTLKSTRHLHDHVSLSGGEPSLDPRLLNHTIRAIASMSHFGIGITTNGQFLESPTKTANFIEACSINGDFVPYYINISRHAFATWENNRLMKVSYHHDLDDIFAFRKALPPSLGFRLNMVLTKQSNVKSLFKEALALRKSFIYNNIMVAFRVDYADIVSKEKGLIPQDILDAFFDVFGDTEQTYSCPTCVTYIPYHHHQFMLTGGDSEPTDKEAIQREFVFHQDGNLYHDWKRNKPVNLSALPTPKEVIPYYTGCGHSGAPRREPMCGGGNSGGCGGTRNPTPKRGGCGSH